MKVGWILWRQVLFSAESGCKRREKIQCHECFLNRKISYLLRRGAMRTYLWTVLGVSLTWKFPIWRHRMARGHTLVMREGIPNVIGGTSIFCIGLDQVLLQCWRHARNPLAQRFVYRQINWLAHRLGLTRFGVDVGGPLGAAATMAMLGVECYRARDFFLPCAAAVAATDRSVLLCRLEAATVLFSRLLSLLCCCGSHGGCWCSWWWLLLQE